MRNPVANRYLVQLQDVPAADVERVTRVLERVTGASVDYIFRNAALGFSATMTEAQALALAEFPNVAFVEEVAIGEVSATQPNPPWHLDRIDQKNSELPLNQRYEYCERGANTIAYVIGTGVAKERRQVRDRSLRAQRRRRDG